MIQFDPNIKSTANIKTGDYLEPYLKDTNNVKRYIDPRYPKGLVYDRLSDHIVRLRFMVEKLPLSIKDREYIDRMILVHDLPETILGDITAIIKKEKTIGTGGEIAVAKKMLNKKDFLLYKQFSDAEDYLLSNSRRKVDERALIAKTLDSIEGSLFFHTAVAKWIQDGHKKMPPDSGASYFFDFILGFANKTHDAKTNKIISKLLLYACNYISDLWSDNERKMPEYIKKGLENSSLYNIV
jgi:hypothetical protein